MEFEPKSLHLKSSILSVIHPWKVPRYFSVYRDKSQCSVLSEFQPLQTYVAGGVTPDIITRWRHHTTADYPKGSMLCRMVRWVH